MQAFFEDLANDFYTNLIAADRWKLLLQGLGVTMEITILALILGLGLGFLTAIVRSTHDKTGKLIILDAIARLYTTVIRGTPTMVQLLIVNFVIFASISVSKVLVAVICFGFNSGAYICEIVRSGIMSVDEGQFEAGRSLGFSYAGTMVHIILPQAFKNIVPALGNEFITLLKETSISGYIAIMELTKAGDIIRSRTFNAFFPLITVALVYLAIVILFQQLWKRLERRLRKNEQ